MESGERVTVTAYTGEEPRYQDISQYGIIGDCRTAALIGPDGSIDWCCLPHFDSPAVFCRLLDADKGGYMRLAPARGADAAMVYLPGTNILETTYHNDEGRLRVVDFMPIRKRLPHMSVLEHLSSLVNHSPNALHNGLEREVGNDVAAAHRIDRIATCLEGSMRVEISLKASFDYARRAAQISRELDNGESFGAILSDGARFLVLLIKRMHTLVHAVDGTEISMRQDGDTLRISTTLHAGQGLVAALNYARDAAEARTLLASLEQQDFDEDLQETRAYWRDWSATSRYDGTYQYAVMRSALTLKLCTFEPTGAIIAAPTTSLPEAIGGVRNWDYRFTWLRDSSFTLAALERLGYYDEARDFFHFLHDLQIESGDDLRIMYGIRGESGAALAEQTLDHLEGYKGSHPVRVGNGAAEQRQLDVYGEVLDAAYSYIHHEGFRHHHSIRGPNRDLREFSVLIADYVQQHWQDMDRGIWEVRGDPKPFVYSRAMCWVAVDRACKLAHQHGHLLHAKRWTACGDALHNDVVRNGYDEELRSFVQAYGTKALDAANLRLGLVGFLPWDDARIASTVEATERELSAPHAQVYRYRIPAGDGQSAGNAEGDGLPGTEGTFLACAFWLIDNLCYLGRVEEARHRFEEILSCAGPLGLFAEELDPDSGRQLGNYPQAFTHIGLINSAVTLQRAQEGSLIQPREGMFPE